MKTKWPKVFERTVPLYGGRVVLVTSHKKWGECVIHLSKTKMRPTGAGAHQCFSKTTKKGFDEVHMVGVFDGQVSTLIHELSHCAFSICDGVGIPVREGESNEAYCYLIESMFLTFVKALKK